MNKTPELKFVSCLTLSYLNLFKEINKKINLKHNQTIEKQIDILFMSISETAELYQQGSKLCFNNAKWNHQAFYSIYRSRGVRKLVIPVGITRSERECLFFTLHAMLHVTV
jgi:hypothetical protein